MRNKQLMHNGLKCLQCLTDINDCSPHPCLNGGTCIDRVDDYTCNCITGYTGKRCETNINDCSPDPCLNGGTCIDRVDDYTCNCITGYTGKRCGTNIDDCASNPCLNGGLCTDGVNDFTCACRTGFSSKRCNTAALGASCSVQGTSCEDTNSECGSGTKCVCKNSHYDNDGTNNIGGTCMPKVVVGGICLSPTTTCADSVATCEPVGGNYRCLCPSTHYDNNGVSVYGGNCERKKRLGEVCPLTSSIGERVTCVDSNARCLYSGGSYKCRCADTHYDSDGTSTIGGTCVS
ncbi:fibropellin-3-like, partial [Mercenaria mercenaria]|uniref:fibropellin-3-like n=1 Tax=Mercenaria mercenaria TaxID=6596 RepID=UPI00234ED970